MGYFDTFWVHKNPSPGALSKKTNELYQSPFSGLDEYLATIASIHTLTSYFVVWFKCTNKNLTWVGVIFIIYTQREVVRQTCFACKGHLSKFMLSYEE